MNFAEITKVQAIEKLESYRDASEEIFKLLASFREETGNDRRELKTLIEEKYASVKGEVKEYYNILSKSSTVKNNIAAAYFWPAIQDIYVHISGVAKNRVGSDAFRSAVYDIGSYSRIQLRMLSD